MNFPGLNIDSKPKKPFKQLGIKEKVDRITDVCSDYATRYLWVYPAGILSIWSFLGSPLELISLFPNPFLPLFAAMPHYALPSVTTEETEEEEDVDIEDQIDDIPDDEEAMEQPDDGEAAEEFEYDF
eukprot:gb/GECH01013521.1/.p1 GENE.gb/GECH01013521.1/~~gb/GECH01013521.1/.p1  ORF type:complete len:127 (+),score=33.10 gb/GECH01013521.1/:1-381(+)